MQELIRRETIKAALAGKSEKSLGILIKFIQRYILKNILIIVLLNFKF